MKHKVEINLGSDGDELARLFSYSEQLDGLSSLYEFIAHAFNQCMLRDQLLGGWTQVLLNDEKEYILKMFCPHHDIGEYEVMIPAFMKAARIGLRIYKENKAGIEKADWDARFLLPCGLTTIRTRSVQLLHYPPLETFVYNDYLYSPTNRRWENLLGYNHPVTPRFSELETIVDCVPLAAPGSDGDKLTDYNNTFTPYVKEMLQARLKNADGDARNIVAYGGPVRDWLEQAYADQIDQKPGVLTLIHLDIFGDGSTLPVLCANHPSMYLYYSDEPYSDRKKEVMTQDLIAAGWQAKMSFGPEKDAQAVLTEMIDYWNGNRRVRAIMEQEDQEYSYSL